MFITIDPELFRKAIDSSNYSCVRQVHDLTSNRDKYRFLMSHKLKSTLFKITEELGERKVNKHKNNWIMRLLQVYINEPGSLVIEPHNLPGEIREKLNRPNIGEEEEILLEIVYEFSYGNEENPLCLLLPGPKEIPPVRYLYEPDAVHLLMESVNQIQLHYASNLESITSWQVAKIEEELHSKLFEVRVSEYIGDKFNCPKKHDGIEINDQQKANKQEIDIYRYQSDEFNPRLVYIGECKLRFGQDNQKPITEEEINQLHRELKFAKSREEACNDRQNPFQLIGFIASNAETLSDKAEEEMIKISEEMGIKVGWMYVKMPKKWQTNPKWTLSIKDFKEIKWF